MLDWVYFVLEAGSQLLPGGNKNGPEDKTREEERTEWPRSREFLVGIVLLVFLAAVLGLALYFLQ
jgi:hypothetical protein